MYAAPVFFLNGTARDRVPSSYLLKIQVGAFLESISPYAWADLGIALCIGLSVVGAAW